MPTLEEVLAQANALRQQGKLAEAEGVYRQIIAALPEQAEAHYQLGTLLQQQGRLNEAVEPLRRSVQLVPLAPACRGSLATVLMALRQFADAEDCFEKLHTQLPDNYQVAVNLGVARLEQRKLPEAVATFERALAISPEGQTAHFNLGVALVLLGRREEAAGKFERAIELYPNFAEAYGRLGEVRTEQGQPAEGARLLERASQLNPNSSDIWTSLGQTLRNLARHDEAAQCYRRATQVNPKCLPAYNNLGVLLLELGRYDEAAAALNAAAAIEPNRAEIHNNLGMIHQHAGQFIPALTEYRRARELAIDSAEVCNNLGLLMKENGLIDEAIEYYKEALRLKPSFVSCHSNLLNALHYQAGCTAAALDTAHREWDHRHATAWQGAAAPPRRGNTGERPLRLGFVSADLGGHPVGFFLIGVLEARDRSRVHVTCYSDRLRRDEMTGYIQELSDAWRETRGLRDETLAQQIAEDQIDVLFDLAGHTAQNRLFVFARRPAPMQLTWMGYTGTTGVAAIDYLVADRYHVPPGAEEHYRERVLRMPDGYVCYRPPDDAPAVNELPALARGHLTFGCFNSPAKLTHEVLGAWAEILKQVPTARLVLKYSGYGDAVIARRFRRLFAERGVAPERLELLPWSGRVHLLQTYNEVDLALDPFPYSGGLTTCEALWMGVPVVTFPGDSFASRHSFSHLSNAGCTETIAHDVQGYVTKAVEWAGQVQRLAELRRELRERMRASPLCDTRRFTANFLEAIEREWSHAPR